MDVALPFGLRSAPLIFTVVADVLQWVMQKKRYCLFHYIDDFIMLGHPLSSECAENNYA